jgi:hypothetical protein
MGLPPRIDRLRLIPVRGLRRLLNGTTILDTRFLGTVSLSWAIASVGG